MKLNVKFWLKISFLDLCIVALLGVIMRYKIGFEFPYLNQKNLQHAHSHFAFSGWVSHTLMTLMVFYLQTKISDLNTVNYRKIIVANLICSFGMLFSFTLEGYGLTSIILSTFSIVVSYIFAYQFWRDLKRIDPDSISVDWFKTALFFNIISSFGTFYLAYMMASKNVDQDYYLSSVYYFLHFQYNGWFFFGAMGLLFGYLNLKKSEHSFYIITHNLLALACIPAYFLSTLWLKLPNWLYVTTVLAAMTQVYAWFRFLLIVLKTRKHSFENYPNFLRYILVFIAFSLSVKLLLQLGSTIPAISQLAFGFRPIVIAYLHLVFLAIISLFLLFYVLSNHLILMTKKIKTGILLFSVGVVLNEMILAIQGIASFSYTVIPYADDLLFGIALLLFFGIGYSAIQVIKKVKNNPPV